MAVTARYRYTVWCWSSRNLSFKLLRNHWDLSRQARCVYVLFVIPAFCELIHKDLGQHPIIIKLWALLQSGRIVLFCAYEQRCYICSGRKFCEFRTFNFVERKLGNSECRCVIILLLILSISTKELLVIVLAGVLCCGIKRKLMCYVRLVARLLLKYISYVTTVSQIVFEETLLISMHWILRRIAVACRFPAHIMTSLY